MNFDFLKTTEGNQNKTHRKNKPRKWKTWKNYFVVAKKTRLLTPFHLVRKTNSWLSHYVTQYRQKKNKGIVVQLYDIRGSHVLPKIEATTHKNIGNDIYGKEEKRKSMVGKKNNKKAKTNQKMQKTKWDKN